VLGPLLEEYLRRSMIISRGDPSVFVTRPISLTLLIGAVLAILVAFLPASERNARRRPDSRSRPPNRVLDHRGRP
jgi:TctA family transporter